MLLVVVITEAVRVAVVRLMRSQYIYIINKNNKTYSPVTVVVAADASRHYGSCYCHEVVQKSENIYFINNNNKMYRRRSRCCC